MLLSPAYFQLVVTRCHASPFKVVLWKVNGCGYLANVTWIIAKLSPIINYQLSIINYQLSIIGFQFSVFNYRLCLYLRIAAMFTVPANKAGQHAPPVSRSIGFPNTTAYGQHEHRRLKTKAMPNIHSSQSHCFVLLANSCILFCGSKG